MAFAAMAAATPAMEGLSLAGPRAEGGAARLRRARRRREGSRVDAASPAPRSWIATIVKVVLFFTVLLVFTALSTYIERRVAGFIQDRSGPNRVGPVGLLQVAADGLKFILKEEVAPEGADA